MEYEHLRQWTLPANYYGEHWDGYYSAGVGQSRDSDALERANFAAMLARLGGESETVIVVQESHWAVGWVEWIAIDPSDTTALETADGIQADLENYPVIDEETWSEYENADCEETWTNCYNERERFDYLKRHLDRQRDDSYAPTFHDIRAACRDGSWYHAANILPCPSDILH